jgi:hypothetical protein
MIVAGEGIRNDFGLVARGDRIPCSDGFIPCSRQENSLFRFEQGICMQKLRIAALFGMNERPDSRKSCKFPVIFPVFRESRTFQNDDPISADRLIVDICKHRD